METQPTTLTSLRPAAHQQDRYDQDIEILASTSSSTYEYTTHMSPLHEGQQNIVITINNAGDGGSTGQGILIGMLSAFGSAVFVALLFGLIYFLRNTTRGRILLDRVGRPGQYDDEQQMLREEAEALETMGDLERTEYLRAKGMCGWTGIIVPN